MVPAAGRRIVRTPQRPPSAPEPTDRQTTQGVVAGAEQQPLMALLKDDFNDASKPYCTCTNRKFGFAFDPQLGIYLHADPKCWRPSKSYYEAARQAGVLEPERSTRATEGSEEGGDREPLPVPPRRRVVRTPARRGS